MFVSHKDLLWMLRQVDGQRLNRAKIIRKFTNHGISSLLPYFDGIAALFEQSKDKLDGSKVIRALEVRTNQQLDFPGDKIGELSFADFEAQLSPIIIQALQLENFSTLEEGARVRVRLDSGASYVQPGSEGFISEKNADLVRVRFYIIAGRYNADPFSMEIPDAELEVISTAELLARHQDFDGIAQYFIRDSLLRVMKSRLDASIYTFAAELGLDYLVAEGFVKVAGDEYFSVPERIFPVLAPKLDATYRDTSLFSSHSLSSPPSERKAHVLRLELTTGCDYNRCTFCCEYADIRPVTKTFAEFKDHVDRVVESIGSEKARIQRLFIGSGNSLGVETGLLLDALSYAGEIFHPQRISLYGRTTSILEKSVAELKQLREKGLSLIYWGLESGSDEVLRYVCKDCSRQDMIDASKMLVEAEIETSAMLMPGVGGLRLSDEHVAGTLELLHSIELNYLTLLAVNPGENSLYERNMQAEPGNRHLTPDEVNAQVYKLLEGLNPTGLQIGMFTEEVDQVSSNTMRFNYQFTESNKKLLLRDFWQ